MEVEYVVVSNDSKEAMWSTNDRVENQGRDASVACDSQNVIQLAKYPMFHAKTTHVDAKYHFIKELIEEKHLQVVKVYTIENLANLLTKGLPKVSFEQCRTLLGIG